MAGPQTIRTRAALRQGIDRLCAIEPVFVALHDAVGEPPLRLSRPGLATTLRVITEQSISLKAAAAIWRGWSRPSMPMTVPASWPCRQNGCANWA